MLDAKGLEAARAAYQSVIPDGAWHANGGETDAPIRAAITAYLQAAGPEPAVAVKPLVEQIDALLAFENPVPPIPNLARSLLASARSALVATPPAERVVEVAAQYAERLANVLWEKHYRNAAPNWKPLTGDLIGIITQIDNMTSGLALTTKPAVKDDDTVVEALDASGAIDAVAKAVAELQRRINAGEYVIDTLITNLKTGNCPPEKAVEWFEAEGRAALAAKEGRS